MIRLFRKIRKELLSEDKYPIYLLYASGEISLVVIGILFALQIDNWNENRHTRRTEQLLLNSLKEEMSTNLESLNLAMSYHTKSRMAAKRMIEIYNGTYAYNNTQEVDSLLSLLQWAWTFDPSTGVINSIKMSGYLNSIQNPELRALISIYEDLTDDATEESKLIQNLIITKYVPGVNNYISHNQRATYLGEAYMVGPSAFVPDYKGLFLDRAIESLISYIYVWRIDELQEEIQLKEMMERFILLLDEELVK